MDDGRKIWNRYLKIYIVSGWVMMFGTWVIFKTILKPDHPVPKIEEDRRPYREDKDMVYFTTWGKNDSWKRTVSYKKENLVKHYINKYYTLDWAPFPEPPDRKK